MEEHLGKGFRLSKPELSFPLAYAVTAFGRDEAGFPELVFDLVGTHAPEIQKSDLSSRASGQGAYLAVTIQFTALNRAQLDAIYQALSDHDRVLMVL